MLSRAAWYLRGPVSRLPYGFSASLLATGSQVIQHVYTVVHGNQSPNLQIRRDHRVTLGLTKSSLTLVYPLSLSHIASNSVFLLCARDPFQLSKCDSMILRRFGKHKRRMNCLVHHFCVEKESDSSDPEKRLVVDAHL